ncbi:flagellar biosynthesis anti-sigma factor FlgM [Pantoea sp. BAV 3049]|uniref:flagellar biosynthesis anti-sigma factor FlgM n=1 Tax=Pantoea sp. BAV 3049 TaxID=2654188 RepID=UPI00131A9F9C|nr:flagellar biosynthesis anti-sigma factor FlgM [Pantoea sp. BAV 3049]
MKISAENLIQSSSAVNNVIASAVESPGQQARVTTVQSGPVSQTLQALRAMPEVDSDRVSAMQAAIRNGELSLNSGSLASAMMDYYRR